ncbi:hypothetical protein, partial [Roseinatronobacter sp.]|uniref:hypothetical protein n=1 Tax=Roseinatronobacter sp. TaxID=1945755 RepID=UPI0025DDD915
GSGSDKRSKYIFISLFHRFRKHVPMVTFLFKPSLRTDSGEIMTHQKAVHTPPTTNAAHTPDKRRSA